MSAESPLLVVTGATGHIGSRLAENLLRAKKRVRAVGRDRAKLDRLGALGADVFIGDVENQASMDKAFSGAHAVFTLIPPKLTATDVRGHQNLVSTVFFNALKTNRVPTVLNLSSVGAHLKDKVGPVNGLHDNEQRLNALEGAHVLHLRPCYFMENLLMNVDLIKNLGITGSPLKGEVMTPMIATWDIAEAAADILIKLEFQGKSVRELLGQRDLSMLQVTRALSRLLKRPDLKYVQFSYEDAGKAMVKMGMSQDAARLMLELSQSINDGIFNPTENRSILNTTKTSFEEFARIFPVLLGTEKQPASV